MTASVEWRKGAAANESSVLVPLEAVFSDDKGETIVWRVNPATETVERVKVLTGDLTDNGIEVRSGLTSGDRILAAGVHFVTAGQRVRPMTDISGG